MGSQAERMCSKVVDHAGEVGLAEWETYNSKLVVNYCRGCHSGRNSQSHMREFTGKQASFIVPSLTPPPRQCHNAAKRVTLPWQIPKDPPLYNTTGALSQRNMAQMKAQIETPEKAKR